MKNLNDNKKNEQSLMLPAFFGSNKAPFLCDLIAFIFFIKGQCPSFKEVEEEVKMLLPAGEDVNGAKKKSSSYGDQLQQAEKVKMTPAKPAISTCGALRARPMFTCYASPIDCKIGTKQDPKSKPIESANLFTCYASPIECKAKPKQASYNVPLVALSNRQPMSTFVHATEELCVSFINDTLDSFSMNISIGFSTTFDSILTSAKKGFAIQCATRSPILHIKRNVQQERMLRCLAEVVPAVLLAAPHCDAIMLAFGQSLLSLDQAVMLEFTDTSILDGCNKDQPLGSGEDCANQEDEDVDKDNSCWDDLNSSVASVSGPSAAQRQRQLVFSQLLGVSGLADAIPPTSMHVLLRLPRRGARACATTDALPPPPPPPPPAPFRPRPQFRLRPACQLIRLTLPCCNANFSASATKTVPETAGTKVDAKSIWQSDSMWFHSATPVPGYALVDSN